MLDDLFAPKCPNGLFDPVFAILGNFPSFSVVFLLFSVIFDKFSSFQ